MTAPAKSETKNAVVLEADAREKLDLLRGETPPAVFLDRLLADEQGRRDKADYICQMNNAYTEAVAEETLRVNESYPVSDE